MTSYCLERSGNEGLRVVDLSSGDTAVVAGRRLENLSTQAAQEILAVLQHREEVREEHAASCNERGDLAAILQRNSTIDETAISASAESIFARARHSTT